MCVACQEDSELLEKIMEWVTEACLDDSRECKGLVETLQEEAKKYNEKYGK